jgi:hypothetical protein
LQKKNRAETFCKKEFTQKNKSIALKAKKTLLKRTAKPFAKKNPQKHSAKKEFVQKNKSLALKAKKSF